MKIERKNLFQFLFNLKDKGPSHAGTLKLCADELGKRADRINLLNRSVDGIQ